MEDKRKIVYVDMDDVLVDFQSGLRKVDPAVRAQYPEGKEDDIPGIFALMDPMPGAIEAFHKLAEKYNVFILSTAPWNNPTAASDKVAWVKRYLGDVAEKRLILTHHKYLNKGDYLIDDRPYSHNASLFEGKMIDFGPKNNFPDWPSVLRYLEVE